VLLGLLVGLRHAFEPDHLTAVSTLVVEARDARRSALLGAMWGLGHTVSLLLVGIVLLLLGTSLPAGVTAAFEGAVAAMLVLLGVRSIVLALREGARGETSLHRHGGRTHAHAASAPHVHLGGAALSIRPLVVGLIHGLAGSGAVTALVFAELPDTLVRLIYIAMFGVGSIAGMAIGSGCAGAALHRVAATSRVRRALGLATGTLSVLVGVAWSVAAFELAR
jgi:hypothetical protein